MKIYTKKGDDGTTGLLYGTRVDKSDNRTEAYGGCDEAVAAIGIARSLAPKGKGLADVLLTIQRQLFVVGAELATASANTSKLQPGVSKTTEELVKFLEDHIDEMTSKHPLPENFIVPGESQVSAALDLARSIVRRAERATVRLERAGGLQDATPLRYLNRLSDFLFVAARYEESETGREAPPSRS